MPDPRHAYDAIVVGAGPGGATAATFMARAGLNVLLLDKATFPRDKICGDAISGKSVDVLKRLGLVGAVMEADQVDSWGVTFGGPGGEEVAIPFTQALDRPVPPGFVCARTTFDELIVRQAVRSGAELREGAAASGLIQEDGAVRGVVIGGKEEVRAPLVIGADGAYSVVARSLGIAQLDERYYSAGLRVYYRGVDGFDQRHHIELHFLSEAIPGYFWIFPMANGMANVGIGMLSATIKKKKVKLRDLLETCIAHPRFESRFEGAERVGGVKGWGLPLGSKPKPMAGDGWMLIGDAAGLIDPFTGEGIGNAMVGGEIAARMVRDAHVARRFDGDFLAEFEREVMRYMGDELRVSHGLQRLTNMRRLLSLVIRKAARSPEIANAISCMFDDETQRERLLKPSFYLKLIVS